MENKIETEIEDNIEKVENSVEVLPDFQGKKIQCEKEIQAILEKYDVALDVRHTIVLLDLKQIREQQASQNEKTK